MKIVNRFPKVAFASSVAGLACTFTAIAPEAASAANIKGKALVFELDLI